MSGDRFPRTLLVSEIFPPRIGGSGRWFFETYRRLPREAFLIAAGEHPGQEEFDRAAGLAIRRLPLTFPTRFLRPRSLPGYRAAWSGLRRLVRDEGIEVVHCGRAVPEGLLGLALKLRAGVAYAVFAHGEEVNLSNPEARPPRLRRRVYGSRELAALVGLVLSNASYLVANSDSTRRILTARWGLPAERVRRLRPGVDTRLFRPAPADDGVRAQLGWTGRRVLLTVGRLQKRKGHDVMIDALPAIRARVPEALYAIVGDGEERPALERRARELGVAAAVQFLGEPNDDELVRCYQQCDLFALPNRAIGGDIEGFGMVLLEAQACGRPVLAGASGGTAETLRDRETGRVVPCEAPDGLAAAVIEMLSDPLWLAGAGKAARRWAVETFDWEIAAGRAAAIFARTAAADPAAGEDAAGAEGSGR